MSSTNRSPKLMLLVTAEYFEKIVINFGCPECHTHVLHDKKCSLGQAFELIADDKAAKLMPKCPRCGFPQMIVYQGI